MRPTTVVRTATAGISLLSVLFVRCTDSNDPLGGSQASIAILQNTADFSAMATGSIPEAKVIGVKNGANAGTVTGQTNGFIGSLTATVNYAAGSANGWLDASLDRQSDPADLTLKVKTTSVLPGTHRATVQVAGKLANSGKPLTPQVITVTYQVEAGPTIAVNGTALDFETWSGGPDPTSKSLQVTNSGVAGSTLEGLTTSVGAASWLRASFDRPTAPANLVVSPVSQGLAAGNYSGTVTVSSGVTTASRSVGVTFRVTPGPSIAVAPSSVAFSAVVGATPGPQSLSISNSAGGVLSGLAVGSIVYGASATGWLNAALSGSTAPATLTLQPQQAVAALAVGTYTATVPVTSTIFGVTPASINVALTVSAGPSIAFNPTDVSFQADAGAPVPEQKDVQVTNGGGGTLQGLAVGTITYTGSATGWLNASLTQSAAPSVLRLQPSKTNVPAGTYGATVQVTSTTPGVAAKTVAVTYVVRELPFIVVTPTTNPSFTTSANGALPLAQTLTVSTGGVGSLGILSWNVAYQGAQTGWLTASLTPTGGGGTLTLRPNTTALAVGTISAVITIESSTPGVASARVTISYQITPVVPVIQLDKSSLSLSLETGYITITGPTFGSVQVTNPTAGTTLSGLSASVVYQPGASNWITTSFNQTTAPATLLVRRSDFAQGVPPGTYTATVTVSSTSPGAVSRTIAVTFEVTPLPCIAIQPTSVTFTTTQFVTAAPQVINVTNGCGPQTLSGLNILGDLLVGTSLASSTAPTTLTLSAFNLVPAPKPPGTYTGSVTLFAEAGFCCLFRTPKPIPYTLIVNPGIGTVTVTPSTATRNIGTTVQLTATVQASPTLPTTVTWSTSNANIATVSTSGLVTAVGKGTATITATSTADVTKTGTASITVP